MVWGAVKPRPTAGPEEGTPHRQKIVESWSRDVSIPVAIRVVEMLFQLVVVAVGNAGSGRSLLGRFTIWDGQLYAQVAQYGYPHTIRISPTNNLVDGNNLAFSPTYPGLVSFVHAVTGLNILDAELLTATIAGSCLAVLIHLIVRTSGGTRAQGYVACTLIGCLPMAVVFQMGYAEALFAALSAGSYLAAVRGRWLTAGSLAFVAGATRPVGYLAAAPLAFIGLAQRRQVQEGSPAPSWRKIVGATALGLCGTPAYWGFVALRTHQLFGWFTVERAGWGTHFDWGSSTAHFIWDTLHNRPGTPALAWFVVIILFASLAAVIVLANREHLPYFALGLATLLSVVMSTNFWHSKPRLLLPAALLVIPFGCRLASVRARYLVPTLALGVGFSAYFGAYMITRWRFAI